MAVKRHLRAVAMTVGVVLGGAWVAAAQTPQARIDAALARATEAGIPVALLQSKVAEGRAKGVSLERIAAAVERRGAALEHARDVLRGPREVDQAGLSVAADAVEAGIDPQRKLLQVRQLRNDVGLRVAGTKAYGVKA